MKRLLSLLLPLLICSSHAFAQPALPATPGQILLSMQKLATTGSVLYIAAHPDDENTKLLAYLANERHLRTGYLSLTRGDGGQNLIGKEQGEMLGLLRTQELLAARRIDGAEQFFTRANDFGFSKNPEETFSIWDKEQVLGDVVWIIRKFRPDVIICRFPTTGEGGHGHHTASAMLAGEAFDAAADPKRFPEQLQYVSVWQPRRLFWNTFNFGGNNTTSPDQLKIDVGVYNPLLGKSYGEIAAESRTMHKSQGFGTALTRGESFEYFKQLRGDTVKGDLFEGINTTWTREKTLAPFAAMTAALVKGFDPMKPEASVPGLVALCKKLRATTETNAGAVPSQNRKGGFVAIIGAVPDWRELKIKQTEKLIVDCAGIWAEAIATTYSVVPEDTFLVNAQIVSRTGSGFELHSVSLPTLTDTFVSQTLNRNVLYSFPHKASLLYSPPYSSPYWLNERHSIGSYVVDDRRSIGEPENYYGPRVFYWLSIAGMNLYLERPIHFKSTDPVKGEIYRPLEILPPVTIAVAEKVLVFSGTQSRRLTVTLHANEDNLNAWPSIQLPPGWKLNLNIDSQNFLMRKKGDEITFTASIQNAAGSQNGRALVTAQVNGQTYSKSIRRFEYDHVPYQFSLTDAEVSLVNIDLKKTGKTIGYIPGAGDDVPAALTEIGYTVTTLTNDMLATADLSRYDAIVAGVRAFNVNDQLPRYHDRLMAYVKGGGNFLVQYNTNTRLGPMTAQPGPWPLTVTGTRVTDENAAVTFTAPEHPALNYPNKITQSDFSGWVQERGIYFAADSAGKYEMPLAMADKGEKPQSGSLLIAPYGKGNFVYTGLVFFRQLPAGNPGAYRLFVNLLSLPRHEERKR